MLKPSFLSEEYLVSDEGYVLSKKHTKLKPSKSIHGYWIVNLMVNGKQVGVAVHALVARAFCEGYEPGLTVNHKDGNKDNNSASNLEWMTSYENTRHAIEVLGKNNSGANNPNAKTVIMVDKKTGENVKSFGSVMDAAKYLYPNEEYKRLRVVQNMICRAASGIREGCLGYIWKYEIKQA